MSAQEKREVRAAFRALLDSTPIEEFAAWNLALEPQLREIARLFPAKALVAAYRERTQEASPAALYKLPFRFCFPRVLPGDLLEFRVVERPGDSEQFKDGYKGIAEPLKAHALVAPAAISVCIVPLLAFDEAGGRLGQGKGFYDRFLSGFSGLKIGLGFECQRAKTLPLETHDHSLDLMVTEKKIRDFR